MKMGAGVIPAPPLSFPQQHVPAEAGAGIQSINE